MILRWTESGGAVNCKENTQQYLGKASGTNGEDVVETFCSAKTER